MAGFQERVVAKRFCVRDLKVKVGIVVLGLVVIGCDGGGGGGGALAFKQWRAQARQ